MVCLEDHSLSVVWQRAFPEIGTPDTWGRRAFPMPPNGPLRLASLQFRQLEKFKGVSPEPFALQRGVGAFILRPDGRIWSLIFH